MWAICRGLSIWGWGADPGYSLRHYRGKYAVPMATTGLFRWCGLCQTVFTAARIILYGFRLTFQQVADVGATGMVIDLLTLSSTFILACWLGKRVFGLDQQTVMLIGAGSSICGAAAIMATEPVLKADASKVAVAVATVVIFGTLAILFTLGCIS